MAATFSLTGSMSSVPGAGCSTSSALTFSVRKNNCSILRWSYICGIVAERCMSACVWAKRCVSLKIAGSLTGTTSIGPSKSSGLTSKPDACASMSSMVK